LPLHHGNDGVRRAEVDADHFSHVELFSLSEPRGPSVTRLLSLGPCRLPWLKDCK
jgi:hypothetical protein